MNGGWTCVALLPPVLAYAWAAWRLVRSTGRRPASATEPIRYWLQRPNVWARIQPWLERPQTALAYLEGSRCGPGRLQQWLAESVAIGGLVFEGGGVLAVTAGVPGLLVPFGFLAIAVPLLRWKDLQSKMEQRKRRIRLQLPDLLSRLAILVHAGENALRALERCTAGRPTEEHPLYAELAAALEAIHRGESVAHALEEFGRRCGVPEAKRFATTVLIHMRRGGDSLSAALRELSRAMWEQRKAAARMLGEQASSRLAFPLVIIFLLIMVMVGTPTLLMMG